MAVLVERGVRLNASANSFQHTAVSGKGGGALEAVQQTNLTNAGSYQAVWQRATIESARRQAGRSVDKIEMSRTESDCEAGRRRTGQQRDLAGSRRQTWPTQGAVKQFDRGPRLRALAARPARASTSRAGSHREQLWPSGRASEPQQGHQQHWDRIDARARAREEAQDGLHRRSWRIKDETLTLKG